VHIPTHQLTIHVEVFAVNEVYVQNVEGNFAMTLLWHNRPYNYFLQPSYIASIYMVARLNGSLDLGPHVKVKPRWFLNAF
jgi:hypothetical protein